MRSILIFALTSSAAFAQPNQGTVSLGADAQTIDIDLASPCPKGSAPGCIKLGQESFEIEQRSGDQMTASHYFVNPRTQEITRTRSIVVFTKDSASFKEAQATPAKYAASRPLSNRSQFSCTHQDNALVVLIDEANSTATGVSPLARSTQARTVTAGCVTLTER